LLAKKKNKKQQQHIAKIPYQTVDARIKPLNSPAALAFSVFCHTVINGMRFVICVTCIFA